MNVIAFAPRRHRRTHLHRVNSWVLASVLSVIALTAAVVLHTLAGVAEQPLVIGTIVVASLASWVNTSLPVAPVRHHDPNPLKRAA